MTRVKGYESLHQVTKIKIQPTNALESLSKILTNVLKVYCMPGSWDDDVVNTPFKDGALAFDSVLGVSFKLFHGETPGFDIGKKWSIDVWVKGPFCDQKGRCLKTFFRGIDRRTGPNQTGGDHQFQMANYDVGMWRNGGFGENLVGDDKDGFQSSGNTGRTFDTMVGTD